MLHKSNRISRDFFDEIFVRGRIVYGVHMYMKIATIVTDTQKPTFSCVVSKKVAKKAHERHLIKRRVYSALQRELSRIRENTHGLIFIKKPEKQKNGEHVPTYEQLALDIHSILSASKSYI